MSQIDLVEAIRRLGFQGSPDEAGLTLGYIGLPPVVDREIFKKFVAGRLKSATTELTDQIGGGRVEVDPNMITSLLGLAVLNNSEPLAEVLAGLRAAALRSAAEETAFFDD